MHARTLQHGGTALQLQSAEMSHVGAAALFVVRGRPATCAAAVTVVQTVHGINSAFVHVDDEIKRIGTWS